MTSTRATTSKATPAGANARQRLRRLTRDLTEGECEHLLALFARVESGERPWEQDVAVFYNDYVKMRRSYTEDAPALFAVPGPVTEDGIFASVSVTRWFGTAEKRQLPPPGRLDKALDHVVATRRTVSRYSGQAISLVQLSTLLYCAAGVTGAAPGYGYRALPRRAFPSAGGLSSPELYVISTSVLGLEPGVYHYDPRNHALDVLSVGDRRPALISGAPGQPFIGTAAVTLVMAGCYSRLRWKYGPRAYRYMCMDVGCQAQNLQLAAAALGLGACLVAGFMEELFEQMIGVDGTDEMALLLATIGIPAAGGADSDGTDAPAPQGDLGNRDLR
jgi:SagB-type dehydrogenase family enzyme